MEQKDNILDRISQEKIIAKMNEVIDFADTLKNRIEEVDGKFVDVSKKIEEVSRIATLSSQVRQAEAPKEIPKSHEEQVVEAKQEADVEKSTEEPTETKTE